MSHSTAPIYVFILNKSGLNETVFADTDLTSLAELAISITGEVLEMYGYRDEVDFALKIEDGFSQIYRTSRGKSKSSSILWTYKFDGEETVDVAQSSLTVAIRLECERLCEQFIDSNNGHFIRPSDYWVRDLGFLLNNLWDDFNDPILQQVLSDKNNHILTVIDDGGLMLIPGYHVLNRLGYIILDQVVEIGEGFRLEPKEASDMEEEVIC